VTPLCHTRLLVSFRYCGAPYSTNDGKNDSHLYGGGEELVSCSMGLRGLALIAIKDKIFALGAQDIAARLWFVVVIVWYHTLPKLPEQRNKHL